MSAAAPADLRLFFALWPDDDTRARLAALAMRLFEGCGGRVTRAESIHVTLAFLGAVPAARLPAAEEAAAAIAGTAFRLFLDRVGCWRHNGIAWAGTSAVPGALARLAADLTAALRARGFALDPRPYVPHVTLVRSARCRELPAVDPIEWRVGDFVLVRSTPAPGGSRYEPMRRWGLAEEESVAGG